MSAPLYSGFPASSGTTTGLPNIPAFQGPKGDTGAAGADGADGVSAFTLTSGNFVQPAVAATVTVSVVNSAWMAPGQPVYITTGGFYSVFNIPSSTSVTLINLGYTGNATAGATVPAGGLLTPSGQKGADGEAATDASHGVMYGTQAELAINTYPGPIIWIISDSVPPNQLSIVEPTGGTGNNGEVWYGTQAEYNADPPAGPGIWILSDSDPVHQMIPIPE